MSVAYWNVLAKHATDWHFVFNDSRGRIKVKYLSALLMKCGKMKRYVNRIHYHLNLRILSCRRLSLKSSFASERQIIWWGFAKQKCDYSKMCAFASCVMRILGTDKLAPDKLLWHSIKKKKKHLPSRPLSIKRQQSFCICISCAVDALRIESRVNNSIS